jgi:hypothetical protein
MNELYYKNMDLFYKVQGTDLDCFFDDKKIPGMMSYIEQHWSDGNE